MKLSHGILIAAAFTGIILIVRIDSLVHKIKQSTIVVASRPQPSSSSLILPKGPIHMIASAGLWLAQHSHELKIFQEDVLIDLDDRGNVYNDDRDGRSGKIVYATGTSFREDRPGYFLIIEGMDQDEWLQLVSTKPLDRHVLVVRALCEQHFPVSVFMEKGLINADNTAFGDPCTAFGSLSSTSTSNPQTERKIDSNARDIVNTCSSVDTLRTRADILDDKKPFTVGVYTCKSGPFLLAFQDKGMACSYPLHNITIDKIWNDPNNGRDYIHMMGAFAPNSEDTDDMANFHVSGFILSADKSGIRVTPTNEDDTLAAPMIMSCSES
jgi:hypothetical protein